MNRRLKSDADPYIPNTEEKLNEMLNSLDFKLAKYKLNIKTKAIVVSKIGNDRTY